MPDVAPLAQSVLDELWDFGDPAGSQERLATARRECADEGQRAELATQEARALGLQGRFDEAAEVLDSITPTTPAGEVRVLLERGRVHNSADRATDAVPVFAAAVELASANGLAFLQIDALHMMAIADPESAAERTREALAVVESTPDRRTRRWAVSLHNNAGWALHERGSFNEALVEFEAAHAASIDVGTPVQDYLARWAVARCLRSLGRYDEALAMQEQLATEDPGDRYVTEELDALRSAMGAG